MLARYECSDASVYIVDADGTRNIIGFGDTPAICEEVVELLRKAELANYKRKYQQSANLHFTIRNIVGFRYVGAYATT